MASAFVEGELGHGREHEGHACVHELLDFEVLDPRIVGRELLKPILGLQDLGCEPAVVVVGDDRIEHGTELAVVFEIARVKPWPPYAEGNAHGTTFPMVAPSTAWYSARRSAAFLRATSAA
jgi:hypothetical protein